MRNYYTAQLVLKDDEVDTVFAYYNGVLDVTLYKISYNEHEEISKSKVKLLRIEVILIFYRSTSTFFKITGKKLNL